MLKNRLKRRSLNRYSSSETVTKEEALPAGRASSFVTEVSVIYQLPFSPTRDGSRSQRNLIAGFDITTIPESSSR